MRSRIGIGGIKQQSAITTLSLVCKQRAGWECTEIATGRVDLTQMPSCDTRPVFVFSRSNLRIYRKIDIIYCNVEFY